MDRPRPSRGHAVAHDGGMAMIVKAAPSHVQSVRENFIDLLTPDEIETLEAIAQRVVDHLGDFPDSATGPSA